MSDNKLRVGIIGIGAYAALAHAPELKAMPEVELTAICRRDPERLAMAQRVFEVPHAHTDWHAMLEQVPLDAVVVATPHDTHFEPALAALHQGLHVMVEKPMVLKGSEARQLVDAADAAGRILMVAYPGSLEAIWRTVKQLIADDAIGRVRQIDTAVCFYRRWMYTGAGHPPDLVEQIARYAERSGLPVTFFAGWGLTWHNDPRRMGGGSFMDYGTHYLDWMRWLGGAPAVEVCAMTDTDGLPTECLVSVQARLANGVLCTLNCADLVPLNLLENRRGLMIVGEKGLIMEDDEHRLWLHRDGGRTRIEPTLAHRSEVEAFVDAILHDNPDYPSGREAVATVDLIEAMYRSAAEHRVVRTGSGLQTSAVRPANIAIFDPD